MASEQRVLGLMNLLQVSLDEVSKLEERLDAWEQVLRGVRDSVLQMEEKDARMKIQHQNNVRLLDVLEDMISKMDIDDDHRRAIDGDLRTPEGIAACIGAAKAIQDAINAQISPGLTKLSAYTEQKSELLRLQSRLVVRLGQHLNNLFMHLGNKGEEDIALMGSDLTLPSHAECHDRLLPYAPLMGWMKATEPASYAALSKVYTASLSKMYDAEIRCLFEVARDRLAKGNTPAQSKYKSSVSSQDLALIKPSPKPPKTSPSLLGSDPEAFGPEAEASADREAFDSTLEAILEVLEPTCLDEQRFCVMFFGLQSEAGLLSSPGSSGGGSGALLLTPQQPSPSPSSGSLSRAGSEEVLLLRKEKQINEELRKVMGELFSSLEPELKSFVSSFVRADGFFAMHVLVRMSQHVMSAQDTGSYLSMTFAGVLVQAKRDFDGFMQAQIRSVQESKVSKKSKCGILPFVENFEAFARQAEGVFKNSERRTDLDRWYSKVVKAMFDEIVRVSSEHQKTPREVVLMENFHHLFDVLSQLKVTCLEAERRDTKQRYSEALQNYVTHYFGRPLEKLNLFFEGVQGKVASGVKESEVGYQMAFSKQELRKVIREYPGREVKRGLEALYRRCERHLCEGEGLLQVVWRHMQEEFICQYKHIEALIERCYPGAKISLEFSISDILEFFSEIARSH